MLFHPIEMVTLIKRRRKQIPLIAMLLPFAVSAVLRIISVYTVNYTVSSVSPKNANIWLELALAVVPVALWAVASLVLGWVVRRPLRAVGMWIANRLGRRERLFAVCGFQDGKACVFKVKAQKT